jgi:chromosome partitioning protein
MPVTISLVARKGGSSKTTTCLNLAGAAKDDGTNSVLVVDMDSQCSLTKALLGADVVAGLRPHETVQAVADRSRAAGDVARTTSVPGLMIVPGHPDLMVPSDAVLCLDGIDADLVLIDTPPDTRDKAVRCALLSSHAVVSPVVPEPWGLQSVPEVQRLLMSAGVVSNERLVFAGWVISMVQRLAMHTLCESSMRRLHGGTVFTTTIPHAATFKEAAGAGQPVSIYAPKSPAAKVTRKVYDELFTRIQQAMQREVA